MLGPCLTDVTALLAEQKSMQLSEGAIWYGLHMLERAGGTMRQHIATENMYEQRLLPEVVSEVSPVTMHEQQLLQEVVNDVFCHETAAVK